jgi:hypothetical protein
VDVYKINTSINVTGNITRELRTIFAAMENVEKAGTRVKTKIDSWGGSIQRIIGEVNHLAQAMGRIHGSGGNRSGFTKSALGFDAKTVLEDVAKIKRALDGVRMDNGGATRSFGSWANSMERAANAAVRYNEALISIRQHAQGGMPGFRVPGGGGGGGAGGTPSTGGGARHPQGTHRNTLAHREAHSMLAGAAAVGMPTGVVHGLGHAFKDAGIVYDQGVIQDVQGAPSDAKQRMLPADIAANRKLAFEYALKNGYTTPGAMAKGITDAADMGKGDFHEARLVAPSIAHAMAVANVIGDEEMKTRVNDKGQARALARALDQMGISKDPERLKQYLPMIEMGMIGTRGIFGGTELLNFVQHSGGEAMNVSPEFVGTVLPMLTEVLKGGALGDSYNQMVKHLYKGTTTGWAETKILLDSGLIKESDLMRNPVNGKLTKDFNVGAIAGSKEWLGTNGKADLFEFYRQVLKPKILDKKFVPKDDNGKLIDYGGTDEGKMEWFVESITKNKGYARMFKEFVVNEDQILANKERFKRQGNPDKLLNETMSGQLKQLSNATETFLTVLADAKVGPAIAGLRGLGEGIRGLAADLYHNPDSASKALGATAGAAAGAGALGAIALAAQAFAIGGPGGVFVAGLVAAAVYIAATDWDGAAKKMKEASTLFDALKNKNPLPDTKNITPTNPTGAGWSFADLFKMYKLGFDALKGLSEKSAENAKKIVEGEQKIDDKTPTTKSWIDTLAEAIARLGLASMAAESGVQRMSLSISGLAGALGGGGSGLQNANFTPGGGGLGGGGSGGGSGGGHGIVPPGITGSDANMLGLISKYESGGRNVMNYIGDRTHTAQGYYQITNSNWRKIAPRLGITAPNAMSASLADQARVAQVLLHGPGGAGNWTRYNPRLAAALRRGEKYHAPTAAVPAAHKAPLKPGQQDTHLYVDGHKLASIMTRHQFKTGNRPATGANIADSSELYPVVG